MSCTRRPANRTKIGNRNCPGHALRLTGFPPHPSFVCCCSRFNRINLWKLLPTAGLLAGDRPHVPASALYYCVFSRVRVLRGENGRAGTDGRPQFFSATFYSAVCSTLRTAVRLLRGTENKRGFFIRRCLISQSPRHRVACSCDRRRLYAVVGHYQ